MTDPSPRAGQPSGVDLKAWIVAIGASGSEGILDVTELLGALPSTLRAIVLVVVHRKWDRPSGLPAILGRACALPVAVAAHRERLNTGTVYLGEPSKHLMLAADHVAELVEDPGYAHSGRTVDLLFKSVSEHSGRRMIGVVLSGSLDDGSRGLAAIHQAGGTTMVLTPPSLAWRGMPENAISYDGPIDVIGDPGRLAQGISTTCLGPIVA